MASLACPSRCLKFLVGLSCLVGTVLATERVLLSAEGSGRATAYGESPKIITFDGKTHAAWLDTPEEGFRVRIRTLDHATGEWGPATTIGEATDNHGGPALTIDEEGYLHVVYYSHHHPFRYRRSLRPNDSTAWTDYEEFGLHLTYPSLVTAADGTLILMARHSYDDRPWELEVWRKPPGEDWAATGSVLRSRFDGLYAQFGSSLAWSPDHRTLHLAARIYEWIEDPGADTALSTVVYLASDDNGLTWRHYDGTPVATPATAETADVIARGDAALGRILHAGTMGVNAAGVPHLVYGAQLDLSGQGYLVTPKAEGGWQHHYMNPCLPEGYRDWDMFMFGGVGFGSDGACTLVATMMQIRPDDHVWGETTTEVVVLRAAAGSMDFSAELLDEPDPDNPRWMPSVERPTGFNVIEGDPGFLYTDGVRGGGLHDVLTNHVYWVK